MLPGNLLTPHSSGEAEYNTLRWEARAVDLAKGGVKERIGMGGLPLPWKSNAYLPGRLCNRCGMAIVGISPAGVKRLNSTPDNPTGQHHKIGTCPLCNRLLEEGDLVASLKRTIYPGRRWRWAPPEVTSDIWLWKSSEIGYALPSWDAYVHGIRKRGFKCRYCEILVLDFGATSGEAD